MNCYFKTEGNYFTLGNNLIERTWKYDEGNLYTVSILNKLNNYQLLKQCDNIEYNKAVEYSYEGLTCSIRAKDKPYFMKLVNVEELGNEQVNEVKDSIYSVPYLEVTFHLKDIIHGVDIKRHAIIYDNVPAVRTFMEVRTVSFPMGEFYDGLKLNVLDNYPAICDSELIDQYGDYDMFSYEFFTRTDHTNHLVEERKNPKGFDRGNIIIYSNNKHNENRYSNNKCSKSKYSDNKCNDIKHENSSNGFFILKESPSFSDQRFEAEGNFYIGSDGIKTLGWGIRPEEFRINEFMRTYACVIGVFTGDKNHGLLALKEYTRARAKVEPRRDYMIMANPWGDRHCLEHMGEEFILSEIEACAKLGATHYQLDDGWQKRGSLVRLSNNEAIEEDYWDINLERFPSRFETITQKSKELNVQLALWFAPDSNRLFRNYEEQAALLYSMYKNYGIKKFKIDGVNLRSKESEENLEKLFKILKEKSKGDISFNLDTTANPRAGYFMFQEYGNIFLENRYTDWGNYYPWLTLKNLWDLSAYVPTQKLQIEFLNIDRNKDKYKAEDKLAPANYSYEYVFAITMFANPLCWFEPSALGSEAMERYNNIINFYKKYRDNIFEGHIFPIGNRPSGYSWTGFQSHNPSKDKGFIIIYREYNDEAAFRIKPLFMEGSNVEFRSLSDESENIVVNNYNGEGIEFNLDKQNSFRLYEYAVSYIVKEALQTYFAEIETKESAYELGKDLFGRNGSGENNLSTTYKVKVKEKIHEKSSH